MFRFESTLTSSPPTVLSNPPSRPGEVVFDWTMTLTRVSPLPDRISRCRSGESLALVVLAKGAFAARTLVLVDMNSAEQRETSRAAVTKRFRGWGRDIHFLQG